jgi:hypothetical protein
VNRSSLLGWFQWEEGEDVERECRRLNMVQILCTHVSGKMRTVETIPGMEEGRIKNDVGGEFNYDVL